MNRPRSWLIAASALVLVLTNAVVLVRAALNRQPPPDTVFTLTERELDPEWNWMWREGENSGASLRLQYRVESNPTPELHYGGFGTPVWLDAAKLAALGFGTVSTRTLARDVLLVLEFDGPAYARAEQTAPKSGYHETSRLFVVDAGLDQTALRQRYPDRTHYAIVHGSIRPYVMRQGTSTRITGVVSAVACQTINVPLQFREAIPSRTEKGRPFTLKIAFGRHLEPWIVSN